MADDRLNVAFKVTWVYGEDGPWTSPCTPEGRVTNIRNDRKVWCNQAKCPCSDLLDTDARLPRDSRPCYDYRGPLEYWFASGVYHQGPKQGQGIPMLQTGVGKFAFLTSRRYGTPEADRIIIASFVIDQFGDIPDLGEYAVASSQDSPYSLGVPFERLDQAPRFWDYRDADASPDWRTGLFRYVSDDEARAMREAIAAVCDDIDPGVWQGIAPERGNAYREGGVSTHLASYYERNPRLRSEAIRVHGTRCQACEVDLGEVYGDRGAGFIEVHHLRAVASYEGEVLVDPATDMAVLCPNCHRIVHRRRNDPLSLDELRRLVVTHQVH